MAGTINSLGVGSGVLTADIIDKLKANDTANMITPLDKKIVTQTQKKSALDLLSSLLSSFKSNVSSLSDDALYQKRSVSGNNDAISVTALSGSALQSFSITDTIMAKKSILESGVFSSATSMVSSGSGTMTLAIDGSNYNISYTSTTSLTDIKDSINATAGAKATASILQTGANEYRLVLTSKETGASQNISLSDSVGGTLNTQFLPYNATGSADGITDNPNGMQAIQNASDASFKYNGISIKRASNSVNDLIVGVTVNLLKDGGNTNIGISQSTAAISDEIKNLVSSYNTLAKQLDDMTLSDLANGKVGIFNGDSTIKTIKREITKMMTSIDSNGQSLAQYGIGLTEAGVMTFAQRDFDAKMSADPIGLEAFFSGKTTIQSNGMTTTGTFAGATSLISSGPSGTMRVIIGTNGYDFNYTGTTTLQDMMDKINADTSISSKLTAKIVQYGNNDYRMVLTPQIQSIGETVSISDSTGGGLLSEMKNTVSTPSIRESTDGVFGNLDTIVNSYTSSKGLMNKLLDASKRETKSLNGERTRSITLLEARYASMTARFVQYDALISKLNSQFSSLQQQISMATNGN